MNVDIREIVPSDIKTLTELNREVFKSDQDHIDDLEIYWPDSELGQKYYTNVVNKKSNKIGFVAETDGVPIGYIALWVKSPLWRIKKYVEIENMGVIPGQRSNGIGTKLLEKAASYAKSLGADRLEVSPFSKNRRALAFYRKFGFEDFIISLQVDLE